MAAFPFAWHFVGPLSAGALFAAVAALGFTLTADGFWTAIAWRRPGGVGLRDPTPIGERHDER